MIAALYPVLDAGQPPGVDAVDAATHETERVRRELTTASTLQLGHRTPVHSGPTAVPQPPDPTRLPSASSTATSTNSGNRTMQVTRPSRTGQPHGQFRHFYGHAREEAIGVSVPEPTVGPLRWGLRRRGRRGRAGGVEGGAGVGLATMTSSGISSGRATFTEQALHQRSESEGAQLLPCATSTAALSAVRKGEADAACVPFENSVEGGVPAVLDGLIDDPPLVIVAETQLAVRFALLARPGTAREDIRTVASHPHGEAQTRQWLAANLPKAAVLMSSSTAEAAAQVARGELDASVSAPIAASVHGLDILADDIADTTAAGVTSVRAGAPAVPGTVADRWTTAPRRCRDHPQRAWRAARCAGRVVHPGYRPDPDRGRGRLAR